MVDSAAVEKELVRSRRRKYNLDKACRLTMVEGIMRCAKVNQVTLARKLKIIPTATPNRFRAIV